MLNFYEGIHQVMTDDVSIQSLIQKLGKLFVLVKVQVFSHKERAFEDARNFPKCPGIFTQELGEDETTLVCTCFLRSQSL